jgi:hypothetical protein
MSRRDASGSSGPGNCVATRRHYFRMTPTRGLDALDSTLRGARSRGMLASHEQFGDAGSILWPSRSGFHLSHRWRGVSRLRGGSQGARDHGRNATRISEHDTRTDGMLFRRGRAGRRPVRIRGARVCTSRTDQRPGIRTGSDGCTPHATLRTRASRRAACSADIPRAPYGSGFAGRRASWQWTSFPHLQGAALLTNQSARCRNTRPGRPPTNLPESTTGLPLIRTHSMPTGYWCGCSKVARSLTVAASKTTTSA